MASCKLMHLVMDVLLANTRDTGSSMERRKERVTPMHLEGSMEEGRALDLADLY